MISLNEKNFHIKVQEIIDQYYLMPMDGRQKTNLRNGYIEREIHGGMHASRVATWAWVMNQSLQKITPLYVHSSLDTIAKHIHSDAKTVLLLILITAICHDSARQGDGYDHREAESGANALNILMSLGLEEAQARLFSNAIQWKDNATQYCEELNNLNVLAQDCNAFDYIRKLVNLGDTLDIMRCRYNFETSYVFKTLEAIDGFDLSLHHDEVLSLMQSIHHIIHDQSDMLGPCQVRDLNKPVFKLDRSLSSALKLKFEHADNVFMAILQDVLRYPAIAGLIKDEVKHCRSPFLVEALQKAELNQHTLEKDALEYTRIAYKISKIQDKNYYTTKYPLPIRGFWGRVGLWFQQLFSWERIRIENAVQTLSNNQNNLPLIERAQILFTLNKRIYKNREMLGQDNWSRLLIKTLDVNSTLHEQLKQSISDTQNTHPEHRMVVDALTSSQLDDYKCVSNSWSLMQKKMAARKILAGCYFHTPNIDTTRPAPTYAPDSDYRFMAQISKTSVSWPIATLVKERNPSALWAKHLDTRGIPKYYHSTQPASLAKIIESGTVMLTTHPTQGKAAWFSSYPEIQGTAIHHQRHAASCAIAFSADLELKSVAPRKLVVGNVKDNFDVLAHNDPAVRYNPSRIWMGVSKLKFNLDNSKNEAHIKLTHLVFTDAAAYDAFFQALKTTEIIEKIKALKANGGIIIGAAQVMQLHEATQDETLVPLNRAIQYH